MEYKESFEQGNGGKLVRTLGWIGIGVGAAAILGRRQLAKKDEGFVRKQSVTIARTPEELYYFWRDFRNLASFMSHVQSVQVKSETQSHWVVSAPAGRTVEWDAEITEDRPGELIAWRSLEGADVENRGEVRFRRAPGDRGCEIHVRLEYKPPGGALGTVVARLFGEEPGQQLKDDLARLKQALETGEVAQSDASIHRGMHPAQPAGGADPTEIAA